MTGTPTRDQRYLVLRAGERRRAEAGLAKSQADLARLAALSDRLDHLRRNMQPAERTATACDLQLINAMSDQLLRARCALDAPLAAAVRLRDQHRGEAQCAQAREDNLKDHLASSHRAAERAAEIRDDARRIAPRGGASLRLVRGTMP
jgi:hypothetical protein